MGSWRGYSSYGKSALGVSISLPGLDKYLAKIQAAGNNIDDACKDAVNAALPIVEKSMKEGAERHERSGAVVDAIEITPAKQTGNYIYGEVGIDTKKHPEAKHAVFQEYGDGHSPAFPDPFVRPAFDEHKSEIRKAEHDVLKKNGIPVDGGKDGNKSSTSKSSASSKASKTSKSSHEKTKNLGSVSNRNTPEKYRAWLKENNPGAYKRAFGGD